MEGVVQALRVWGRWWKSFFLSCNNFWAGRGTIRDLVKVKKRRAHDWVVLANLSYHKSTSHAGKITPPRQRPSKFVANRSPKEISLSSLLHAWHSTCQ